jgi:hypothetical protein
MVNRESNMCIASSPGYSQHTENRDGNNFIQVFWVKTQSFSSLNDKMFQTFNVIIIIIKDARMKLHFRKLAIFNLDRQFGAL